MTHCLFMIIGVVLVIPPIIVSCGFFFVLVCQLHVLDLQSAVLVEDTTMLKDDEDASSAFQVVAELVDAAQERLEKTCASLRFLWVHLVLVTCACVTVAAAHTRAYHLAGRTPPARESSTGYVDVHLQGSAGRGQGEQLAGPGSTDAKERAFAYLLFYDGFVAGFGVVGFVATFMVPSFVTTVFQGAPEAVIRVMRRRGAPPKVMSSMLPYLSLRARGFAVVGITITLELALQVLIVISSLTGLYVGSH
eukprot:TRINITY_DN45735_c0_g2_i1.p1 TRINITY_DN45735_c0_g2~~TRINITY_DN45735_c0_g2_i1.p1  ORF type:complete len:265 (-),score=21.19 TRINITY_DN45735_c0_g2_i1:325-1071(-)